MPSTWNGFDAVRHYRGVRYEIHVERRGAGNKVALEVNGKAIHGTIIPFPTGETKIVAVVAELR